MTSTRTPTSAATGTHVSIDGRRLWASLTELARIGAYEDPGTGLFGVNRQSLTDEDAQGRRLVISWMGRSVWR